MVPRISCRSIRESRRQHRPEFDLGLAGPAEVLEERIAEIAGGRVAVAGSNAIALEQIASSFSGTREATLRGLGMRPAASSRRTLVSARPFHICSPVSTSQSTAPAAKTSERRSTLRAEDLLGRREANLALEDARLGHGLGVGGLGDPEVDELRRPLVGHEDVVRAHVAVHDLEGRAVVVGELVRVVQSRQRVGQDPKLRRDRDELALGPADDVLERLPLEDTPS